MDKGLTRKISKRKIPMCSDPLIPMKSNFNMVKWAKKDTDKHFESGSGPAQGRFLKGKKKMENREIFPLSLSVLVYSEEGLRVAHCLEMDLKGRGESTEHAVKELVELVGMQVSFALQRNEPGLIYHPAEKQLFEIFNNLKENALKSFPRRPKRLRSGYEAQEIPFLNNMKKTKATFKECYAY
jgi:hypothetical protein